MLDSKSFQSRITCCKCSNLGVSMLLQINAMQSACIAAAQITLFGGLCHQVEAQVVPATVWLSTSGSNVAGPDAATLNLELGTTRTIYIWARPMADGSTFRTLRNFSLNVVSDDASGTYEVIDAQINNSGNRFEIVRDLNNPTDNPLALSQANSVEGLSAGIAQPSLFTGIGVDDGDSLCGSGCTPSWLLGSLQVRGLSTAGTASVHMQIGSLGINHAGALSSETEIVFGDDPPPLSYNGKTDRGVTFEADAPDLTINAIPLLAGDYSGDGVVDAADYSVWRDNVGTSATLPGDATAGVTASDYNIWQSQYGATRSLPATFSRQIPEPSVVLHAIFALVSATLGFARQHNKPRH